LVCFLRIPASSNEGLDTSPPRKSGGCGLALRSGGNGAGGSWSRLGGKSGRGGAGGI
jgi:hypothetical protein